MVVVLFLVYIIAGFYTNYYYTLFFSGDERAIVASGPVNARNDWSSH